MKKKTFPLMLILASVLLAEIGYGQQYLLKTIDSLVDAKALDEASKELDAIDTLKLNTINKAHYFHLLAKNQHLNEQNDKSYANFLKAKSLYNQIDSLDQVAEINLGIVQMLNSYNHEDFNFQPFIDEYVAYAESKNDPVLLTKAYAQIGKCFINSNLEISTEYFKKSMEELKKTNDSSLNASIHHNVGVLYSKDKNKLDSALAFYDVAMDYYLKNNLTDEICYIYINRASIYKKQQNYTLALEQYQKADSITNKVFRRNMKNLLYRFMADTYEKNDQPEQALKYLKLRNLYKDSLSSESQKKALLDIQTKYEVVEKEKENLLLKQNRNVLIGILVLIVLLLVLSYLAFKHEKGKRKLVEKEKVLEQERLSKMLKDQELIGLDAMVEGQEIERQRIANDLHDNLGSLLATLKLHFQNFKIKKQRIQEEENKLFEKTDELIEEAYQKVRSMAHAKNAGVKANESLLPAIKKFATKVSESNQLIIEVVDHDMDDRLENNLEIGIFRIVQELITNVIKHAQATESTIYLTNHHDSINIMVEDNGIGFDANNIPKSDGMGLDSIKSRVENFNGSMSIDSIPHKGTTIIIDIPIS